MVLGKKTLLNVRDDREVKSMQKRDYATLRVRKLLMGEDEVVMGRIRSGMS
jgi:hypothetical protein